MTSPVLLIGEVNPLSMDPDHALYDYPPGCAGHRLRRVLGLPSDQYLALHRTNLCVGDWSRPLAERRARELLSTASPWRVMVLLGRKVTETFERVAIGAPLVPFAHYACTCMTLVSLPHPSGRNAAAWNVKARDRARQILRALAPELPWGSADAQVEASA